MDEKKKTVFISYCWADGTSYADDLEEQLKDYFQVFRDKTQLQANDDIYDFMGNVASCDFVIIVLTKGYVKSRNCMLEITSLAAEPDWHQKAFVLVIDESMYDIDRKIEVLDYWKNQQKLARNKFDESKIGKKILEEELGYANTICDKLESVLRETSRLKNPSQIAIVNEVVRRSENDNSEPKELTDRRARVEKLIEKNTDCTIGQIAEGTNLSMVSTSRILSELRKADKVTREMCSVKNRGVYRLKKDTARE